MKRIAVAVTVTLALGASGARADDVKALFAQRCASCHGADGKGTTAMGKKLGAKDLTKDKDDSLAQIAKHIEDGKPPKMVSYKGKLTPEQIDGLAAFIKAGKFQ